MLDRLRQIQVKRGATLVSVPEICSCPRMITGARWFNWRNTISLATRHGRPRLSIHLSNLNWLRQSEMRSFERIHARHLDNAFTAAERSVSGAGRQEWITGLPTEG
jgi:hypothetical protein